MNIISWFVDTKKGHIAAFLLWPILPSTIGILFSPKASLAQFLFQYALSWVIMVLWLMFITKGRIWSPFCGYDMVANLDRVKEMTIDRQIEVQSEIETWTKDMVGGFRCYKLNEYRYLFMRKRDAMAFKLVWG